MSDITNSVDVNVYVTRRGRVSKPPTRYEPEEICDDDFNESDHECEDSDIESIISTDVESDSDEDEDEDEDVNGNLKGFVVDDEDEDEDEESECD